jgi:hypothetical protein
MAARVRLWYPLRRICILRRDRHDSATAAGIDSERERGRERERERFSFSCGLSSALELSSRSMPNRQGAIEMILERKNEQELSPHCTTGRDERFVSPNEWRFGVAPLGEFLREFLQFRHQFRGSDSRVSQPIEALLSC